MLIIQMKLKSVLCIQLLHCEIAQQIEELFFQFSKPIIQFSKEVTRNIEEQVKFQHPSSLFHFHFTC